MLYLENIYKEAENKKQKYPFFDFKCEHFDQTYNHFSLNISVLLYGAVFLVGKEYGYAGITCPSCLNTILMKGETLTRLQQDMILFMGRMAVI